MDAAGGHLGGWCHRPLRREANDSNSESRGPEGSLRASSVVRTPCILLNLFGSATQLMGPLLP